MQLQFIGLYAKAEILVTDVENVGPDGWRHAQVSGIASSELAARALAQEIKEILTKGREWKERTPFEYKPFRQMQHGVERWHMFARFAFRPHKGTI